MKKNKSLSKDEQIKELTKQIEILTKKVNSTSRKTLIKEVDETNKEVKEVQKFNVKAWLIASSFAICSCALGITNLVLNLVKK